MEIVKSLRYMCVYVGIVTEAMCKDKTAARTGISFGDITVHLSIDQRKGNDSSDRITVFL